MELVRTSECKQGTHVKGAWVEDNKGDIVRSRFVAKHMAYDQRDDVSQFKNSCAAHLPSLAQHHGLHRADFLRQRCGAVRMGHLSGVLSSSDG